MPGANEGNVVCRASSRLDKYININTRLIDTDLGNKKGIIKTYEEWGLFFLMQGEGKKRKCLHTLSSAHLVPSLTRPKSGISSLIVPEVTLRKNKYIE